MTFTDYLKHHIVLLDGGMGTLLQARGLAPGEYPERWNLSHPDVVTAIHKAYFDAGSNVVCANTFGANPLKFAPDELEAIVAAAIANAGAARAASAAGEKFVALDIGPTGRLLRPLGPLDFEDAVAAFAGTVRLGAKYGADLVFIETMNDSYETKAALLAARENCDLPVVVSNAYGADGKLMTGATPPAMVALLEGMGVTALGANCSLGPAELRGVMDELLACASVPVLFKPNAGLPQAVDGRTVYNVTPADFAAEVADAVRRGVRAAGGCCGTTPDYIRALAAAVEGAVPVPIEPKHLSVASSYTHAVRLGDDPVLIGERINPTGKKRVKEALREGNLDFILSEGVTQAEKGAQILDVNAGLPDIDECAVLPHVVCELQAVTDLPLQIDTANPLAMEAALRRYNGKAVINSVNGKRESMEAVFPLVKKYGGIVVALTLDEDGIPATAEGRFAIAKKILAEAERYGIDKKDLLFDTLAMTVSADDHAALTTLAALRRIREELGCHTSLGVSNVSFGLPARDTVNSVFFALALENGLSAAIMNPYSDEMMRVYHTYRALKGLDANCLGYISAAAHFAAAAPAAQTAPAAQAGAVADGTALSPLQYAIVKGMRERAGEITRGDLADTPPLTLVNDEIIPALNRVGEGFEKKTVYLPQLLMSAEAAKSAFEVIKATMPEGKRGDRATVVIATVEGDIHDIGKNIVKLLLENYGFAVVDLGRDVPPAKVADAVVERHAPLVGLSALMTTTVPAMEETIRLLRVRAPWCRVMVGGAVLTKAYAERIGADYYAKDAMESVRYAEETVKKAQTEKAKM